MGITAATDNQLIEAVRAGDRGALSVLYERHAAHMLGLALRLLPERSVAEDLVHDVFVEIWQRSSTYCPERGSVRAWMRTRLRSRAIDRRRSLQTAARHELAAGLVARAAIRQDKDPARQADQTLAVSELQSLPDKFREVAQLVYLEGYTCTEIATRLGLPHGTVKSRLNAARCELQRRLRATKECG